MAAGDLYINTKINFYNDYKENYEEFYNNEVVPGCQAFASNSVATLQSKVNMIKEKLGGLELDWNDSVDGEFRNYMATFVSYLQEVETSIGQNLTKAEMDYKTLKTKIEGLSKNNSAYGNEWDNKPQKDDYRKFVNRDTDDDGFVSRSEGRTIFDESAYNSAFSNWKNSVSGLAQQCISNIDEIESLKSDLYSINGNVIKINADDVDFETSVSGFDVGTDGMLLSGTVAEYIASHGCPLMTYSRWGQDFCVLAPVTGGSKQGSQQCLAYANAYAANIIRRTRQTRSSTADGKTRTYTSMDKQEVMQIAAQELLAGNPIMFEVQGTGVGKNGTVEVPVIKNGVRTTETVPRCNRHFVTVYGIKADADLNNLKESDFIYLDPAGGQVKQLATNNGGSQRRDLVNSQAVTYRDWENEFYCITVYSGENDYAQIFDNVEFLGPRGQPGGTNANVSYSS